MQNKIIKIITKENQKKNNNNNVKQQFNKKKNSLKTFIENKREWKEFKKEINISYNEFVKMKNEYIKYEKLQSSNK